MDTLIIYTGPHMPVLCRPSPVASPIPYPPHLSHAPNAYSQFSSSESQESDSQLDASDDEQQISDAEVADAKSQSKSKPQNLDAGGASLPVNTSKRTPSQFSVHTMLETNINLVSRSSLQGPPPADLFP